MFAAILRNLRHTQPYFIDPAPIVQFLEADQHDRWRYLTLGFGDHFAYLSAQTAALSVDGNYHFARRLPDLTRFSVERLENAEHPGALGLGSLCQFLVDSERYNLKYVFVNDAFYDPLLWFTGWALLNRLQNGIVISEGPDMPPLPHYLPQRSYPVMYQVLWGIVPAAALILGLLVLAASGLRSLRCSPPSESPRMQTPNNYPDPVRVRLLVPVMLMIGVSSATAIAGRLVFSVNRPLPPETVIVCYFGNLDFRRFADAHAMLDSVTRQDLQDTLFAWRWRGRLVTSYSKLKDLQIVSLEVRDNIAHAAVELDWLTALELVTEQRDVGPVRRDGTCIVVPTSLRPWRTPERLLRNPEVAGTTIGRRQPLPEADLQRDQLDRPQIIVSGARLVQLDGRLSVVGQVTNADSDPAPLTLHAEVLVGPVLQGRQAAAIVASHRLRPAESAGFRVTSRTCFRCGVRKLAATSTPACSSRRNSTTIPDGAAIDVRAVVRTDGHYWGVALSGLTIVEADGGLALEGHATNTGTVTATIASVLVLLYGADRAPVWAETGFVRGNLYPGQIERLRIELPRCDRIAVIASVQPGAIKTNGGIQQADLDPPSADDGTWPLDGLGGCSAARQNVSTMTYAPLD